MIVTATLVTLTASVTCAQEYSSDARLIALGGVGGDLENAALEMAASPRPYRTIVVPLGLVQLVRDLERLDPRDERFDPLALLAYATAPMHYVVGRTQDPARDVFLPALVRGRLSPDLGVYSGSSLPDDLSMQGLAAPRWGGTIPLVRHAHTRHGIYVGAGPYLGVRTSFAADNRLRALLAGGASRVPDAPLFIESGSDLQIAFALTAGYRARFPLVARTRSSRDGLYVGVDYRWLHGLLYRASATSATVTTNALRLIATPAPGDALAFIADDTRSTVGAGRAVDVGVAVVAGPWEISGAVSGMGNGIEWRNLSRRRQGRTSLVNGSTLVELAPLGMADRVSVSFPVSHSASIAYHADAWSAMGDVTRGLNGTSLHAGYERRLGHVALRAGMRYALAKWLPAAGLGLDVSTHTALDVAAFTTTAVFDRDRRAGIAVSFRLTK